MNYVFSEEIYVKQLGKPKGKGVWVFGDRNKSFLISAGSSEFPITYDNAKKEVCLKLQEQRYPMYKTIYLHPAETADER